MCSVFSISSNTGGIGVGKKEVISHDFHKELLKCRKACSDLHLTEIFNRHSQLKYSSMKDSWTVPESRPTYLQEAYERCTHTFPARDKNIYQGSLLLPDKQKKAVWSIYAWCRRTDDLVDEPNAIDVGVDVLDRWEERLQDIFNGRPHDILDAALTDTVYKFPIDIKPFKDLIDGMRMDITKCRYENFEELYQYCYHVAVAPGLMVVPSVELQPEPLRKLYDTVLYVCIAVQITNILRDVKEDALMGRVYLPQDELAQFGLSEKDIFSKVTDDWKEFVKFQIKRARFYYSLAEEGAFQLDMTYRLPFWGAAILYSKLLDVIEDNDYDNLTKKVCLGRTKMICTLPLAFIKAALRIS